MAFSIPYRSKPWTPAIGPPNVLINFCEEDFAISPYIGEVINTFTNIAYIIYATKGLNRLPQNSSFAARSLYYGLALVGICSALFHSMLKYYALLADDTSMIIATSCVLHRAVTFNRSSNFVQQFSWGLLAAVVVETIYHVLFDTNNKFHELSFLVLLLSVIWATRGLIRTRVRSEEEKSLLTRVTIVGTVIFATAYTLWQLDQIYCPQLTSWKRAIGMPWSFVLEFHGWWHVLTAVAAYVFMVMVEDLTVPLVRDVEFTGGPYAWIGGRGRDRKGINGIKGSNGINGVNGMSNGKRH